ncbi:hypothetical protein GCM10022214_16830 [Actinomadura miaoliensis]|uniref:DNA primase n=1 Tax=Actinomadura miaoliensis TaxID=430685 RepID=A0ABP7VC81_9ACTN
MGGGCGSWETGHDPSDRVRPRTGQATLLDDDEEDEDELDDELDEEDEPFEPDDSDVLEEELFEPFDPEPLEELRVEDEPEPRLSVR